MHRMLMFPTHLLVLLNILGLVLTIPVKPIDSTEKMENVSLDQAFRAAEKVLHRYFYVMNSDTDHLVHGMLHVLMNNPTSSPFVPSRALSIAFDNVEQKLGHDAADTLAKPLLLAIDQHYQTKPLESPKIELTPEIKEEIEDALDKFLDKAEFNSHL